MRIEADATDAADENRNVAGGDKEELRRFEEC